jgi:hypothetical protein
MGFRTLRVINDDFIAGAGGFPMHPHRDMEIISYIVEGSLEHRDSMGNGSVIRPGDVQRMSAGTGVTHSEFNPSKTDRARLIQIWIIPDKRGQKPSYEQKHFDEASLQDQVRLVGSRDGRDGSVAIQQDVNLYAGRLGAGATARVATNPRRGVWVQVVKGSVSANGEDLAEGDGAAIEGVDALELAAKTAAEVLVFDLA